MSREVKSTTFISIFIDINSLLKLNFQLLTYDDCNNRQHYALVFFATFLLIAFLLMYTTDFLFREHLSIILLQIKSHFYWFYFYSRVSLCLLNIHSLFPAKEIFLKQYIEMALLANKCYLIFLVFMFLVHYELNVSRAQSESTLTEVQSKLSTTILFSFQQSSKSLKNGR